MSRTVAFDTETYLIRETEPDGTAGINRVPKMVCAAFYDGSGEPDLLRHEEAVDRWIGEIRDSETRLVGHNLGFDQSVMLRAAHDLRGNNYIPDVIESYENPGGLEPGACADTRIRQMLVDLATTDLYNRLGGYTLENLVAYHLAEDISTWKKRDEDGKPWRLRYAELDPYPISQWPQRAVEYAKKDAEWTWDVWDAQNKRKNSAFGPPVSSSKKGVVNENFQTCADFAFSLLEAWGIGVDHSRAKSLQKRYKDRKIELEEKLQGWGLVDEDGKAVMERHRELFAKAAKKAGVRPVRTDKDNKIATSKKARARIRKTGYTDEKIKTLEQYSRVSDYLTKYLKPLVNTEPYGVFPRWNVLVRTGRSSCKAPNLQNFPKRKHPNEKIPADSIRKCFEPRREDWTFVNADWASAELRSLAQVCENWDLHSEMAKSLREGRDLHLDFAAQLEGVSYEEAEKRYENDDESIGKSRKVAKVANFGFPGGLQPDSFVNYAYDFGVEVEPAEARRLRQAWMNRWPEIGQYFDRIKSYRQHRYSVPIQQHAPGGRGEDMPWRYRRCGAFTEAANSGFQGMVGDGAKATLWMLIKRCFCDKSSDLYGARINLFVHDEYLLECHKNQALGAAKELREVMIEGMELFTPDVPCEADVDIGRVWGEGKDVTDKVREM